MSATVLLDRARALSRRSRSSGFPRRSRLFQVQQPVVMRKELAYQPFPTGVLVPQEMSWI